MTDKWGSKSNRGGDTLEKMVFVLYIFNRRSSRGSFLKLNILMLGEKYANSVIIKTSRKST